MINTGCEVPSDEKLEMSWRQFLFGYDFSVTWEGKLVLRKDAE